MPQLESTKVRVSRNTVRLLWWAYAGGLGATGFITLAITGARGPRETQWSGESAVCLSMAVVLAVFALRMTTSLPRAGHRVFDVVGERFETAMRQLFIRFVLAGGGAAAAGVLGGVLLVLGAPIEVGLGVIVAGLVLLAYLRHRVRPLVVYLA